ncbi:MAG: flagellar assembly peptidoglycan hydrolase FlgJ [Chromatiaceae bacterium]|nr:flagellar assembly peptidoglycan hydrolase FlgJ [Gammaproteobacteria bacterium]MCB1860827.1 flagellar assembly peptidoglycan hydrolase FlgJ [Gammaproteobacteria bacterium]MCP5447885.1 flagellar assembly peptidoglycan hydrolase FlgJ [Chromatiaceae bacterium]
MNVATPLYADFSGLAELKARSVNDQTGSTAEVARQFESLLINQMVKSMRQASLGEGILDSDQSLFYRDMFDQQLSLHLAENGGIGLAAAIQRQLEGAQSATADGGLNITEYGRRRLIAPTAETSESPPPSPRKSVDRMEGAGAAAADTDNWSSTDFVENLWPWALEAANRIGLQPQALLAQAALETGWGRRMISQKDGTPSHNLFGIKADRNWDGARVSVSTLEYEAGSAIRRRDYFRSYDSFKESFNDYVDFLSANPRYDRALAATSSSRAYFNELQKAGYATDPRYAQKIDAVLRGREMRQAVERLQTKANQPL